MKHLPEGIRSKKVQEHHDAAGKADYRPRGRLPGLRDVGVHENKVRHLPVFEGDKLLGLLSMRTS